MTSPTRRALAEVKIHLEAAEDALRQARDQAAEVGGITREGSRCA